MLPEEDGKINKGLIGFGLGLLRNGVNGVSNGIVAVYSVASVLAVTLLGADGNTAAEIKAAFAINDSDNSEVEPMDDEDEIDGMMPSTSIHGTSVTEMENSNADVCDSNGSTNKKDSRNSIKKQLNKIVRSLSHQQKSTPFEVKDEQFHQKIGGMVREVPRTALPTYILRNANRLYIKKNGTISKQYIDAAEMLYGSRPEMMDFVGKPEKCAQRINKWVEEQTESKIKDLISPDAIKSDTSIVIVNAIYFKGDWEDKFDPQMTSEMDFFTGAGQTKRTQFMFKNDEFLHKEDREMGCQVLEIPYVQKDLSFVVVLPNKDYDFISFEKKLTPSNLIAMTTGLAEKDVHVYLPKFKIEISLDLSEVLHQLGIKDVFDENKANLSGIDPKANLYVSGILHKAYIEVNEEGSEAAGATAVLVRAAGLPAKISVFKADHPFFFFIRDNRNNAILFIGKYCEPSNE